ncbi:MAG: hypothetical protein ACE5K8_03660 [Candidatus Zixiibacteriota bacterium]
MMESTTRTLNVLSAVIILAAGLYMAVTFWSLLSPVVQGLIGVVVWLYFFSQIDLYLRSDWNKP